VYAAITNVLVRIINRGIVYKVNIRQRWSSVQIVIPYMSFYCFRYAHRPCFWV
jgi:hypothetical protein